MRTFNAITTAIFDVILGLAGHAYPWVDLLFWPILAGVIALLVYKAVSNQAGIQAAKNGIAVHLLEVVLYPNDLKGVLVSTAKAMGRNAQYIGYNIAPMVVMFVPMTIILVQLVSQYAYAPVVPGSTPLLVVKLDPNTDVRPRDVRLELPTGVSLDAPPVRTPDGEIAWRLKAETPGDYTLKIHAGNTTEEKSLAVGGPPRKVSVMRSKSLEALLYPAEAVPESDSPIYSIRLPISSQEMPFLPDGEEGVLGWFFGASLLAGFVLKDKFGVTL